MLIIFLLVINKMIDIAATFFRMNELHGIRSTYKFPLNLKK